MRSDLAGTFLLRVTSSNVTLAQQNVTFASGELLPRHITASLSILLQKHDLCWGCIIKRDLILKFVKCVPDSRFTCMTVTNGALDTFFVSTRYFLNPILKAANCKLRDVGPVYVV